MAVRDYAIAEIKAFQEHAHVISWTGLLNGDTGAPIEMAGHTIKCAQLKGTFGAGGTIVMQGSNDGVTYVTLTDPQGNSVSKTAEAIEQIQETTRYIRPSVTAGDGTTDLSVYMVLRRNR
jgi:hypothetical protein